MQIARIAVLAVAVGAAGGAALLSKNVLTGRQATVVQQAAPVVEAEQVLVASQDLAMGTRVRQQDLRWQSWPKDALSGHFIIRSARPDALTDMVGAIARAPLFRGEPVSQAKLVQSDKGGFMSAILSPGMRAISIKISPETGAGGFILPNDRVDVILTKRASAGGDSADSYQSETILNNVRVLAIDQSVQEEDGRQVVVGKTATLELGPNQAEVLALAKQLGELSLALRGLSDATPGQADTSYERTGSVRVLRYGVASQVMTSR